MNSRIDFDSYEGFQFDVTSKEELTILIASEQVQRTGRNLGISRKIVQDLRKSLLFLGTTSCRGLDRPRAKYMNKIFPLGIIGVHVMRSFIKNLCEVNTNSNWWKRRLQFCSLFGGSFLEGRRTGAFLEKCLNEVYTGEEGSLGAKEDGWKGLWLPNAKKDTRVLDLMAE